MLNYFLKLINCNKRRTTQGGGVAAPVGGQIFSEILPYLEVNQGNQDEVEVKEEVSIPDITGKTIVEAEKILKENGLQIKINNEEGIDKATQTVEVQTPQPGIVVYKGNMVMVN